MQNFTVLVIATNKYIEFFSPFLSSIDENLFEDASGQVILFTNHEDVKLPHLSERLTVDLIKIPDLGWPDATLKRYEIFQTNWNAITGDFVMYVDVDAIVVGKPKLEDLVAELATNNKEIFVVKHPGYFRRGLIHNIAIRSYANIWENNKLSKAYVPLTKRRTYVAGGVWGGLRSALLQMVSELRQNVDKDSAKGLIALHHDESHLNSWITENEVLKLSPAWVYAPGYKNLKGVEAVIEVIHKPQEFFDARIPES